MTRLLDQGVAAVRRLPGDRQDVAGALLMRFADPEAGRCCILTPEQIAEVRRRMHRADRRAFASDQAMAAFWRRCGI